MKMKLSKEGVNKYIAYWVRQKTGEYKVFDIETNKREITDFIEKKLYRILPPHIKCRAEVDAKVLSNIRVNTTIETDTWPLVSEVADTDRDIIRADDFIDYVDEILGVKHGGI